MPHDPIGMKTEIRISDINRNKRNDRKMCEKRKWLECKFYNLPFLIYASRSQTKGEKPDPVIREFINIL